MTMIDLSWPAPEQDDAPLDATVAALAEADGPADESGAWPDRLWSIVKDVGALRWLLPRELGGLDLDRPTLIHRYSRLAEGSLTAAFILTQHDAAVRRLRGATGGGQAGARRWLEAIAAGAATATVGISQLTTSKRRGERPLRATPTAHGYRLDGVIPWVTAAERASVLVTGGFLDDGRQILVALPTDREGVRIEPAFALAALGASRTTEVLCDGAEIAPDEVLAGPAEEVLAIGSAGGTGGLETSALAIGQARTALRSLASEGATRGGLDEPIEALAAAWRSAATALVLAAEGHPDAPAPGTVRADANALVLRATQAYLTARKGTGFLRSEPAQRWARQALFFLVWSCPTPVAQQAIRDLAGLCDA